MVSNGIKCNECGGQLCVINDIYGWYIECRQCRKKLTKHYEFEDSAWKALSKTITNRTNNLKGPKWSKEDTDLCIKYFKEGLTIKQIQNLYFPNRSISGIRSKLYSKGLVKRSK